MFSHFVFLSGCGSKLLLFITSTNHWSKNCFFTLKIVLFYSARFGAELFFC